MTAIDRARASEAFKTYTDAYDAANPRIALKIEHTYHVAETCDAWHANRLGARGY